MQYTFGTTDTAASRLKTIAHFFNPLAAEFIRRYIKTDIGVAVDLGCGPGFTTQMLSGATNAETTLGFDKSKHFLKLAEEKYPDCNFILQDVTIFPFPVKADLMYCRFLLSHLGNPVELINCWLNELNPNGILFIDELENIYSENEIFKSYLEIADGLVASQNASLFVGNVLAKGNYKANVLTNEYVFLPVENFKAATWFYPNTISIWESEPFILENITIEKRKYISSEILRIKESGNRNKDITWKMRRLAIKK